MGCYILSSNDFPSEGKEQVGGVDISAGNAGVRPATSGAAPPASLLHGLAVRIVDDLVLAGLIDPGLGSIDARGIVLARLKVG
jgi:hypothetical protein